MPLVFSNASDAVVALGRISKFLVAEELAEPYKTEPTSKYAVDVDGDFAWETVGKPDDGPKVGMGKKGARLPSDKKPAGSKTVPEATKKGRALWRRRKSSAPVLPTTLSKEQLQKPTKGKSDEKPFELKSVQLQIPKGAFVAIVGRVGSGKVGPR